MNKILVWDWPVRLGHWLMVGGFIVAWLTAESETWRLVHAFSGAIVIAVALFRLPWGFIGSRYARFAEFVRGPRAVAGYLRSLGILCGLSGWATYNELGGHLLEELHEGLAATMLTVVIVHVAGVISGSVLHGENLVRAMFSGQKSGSADEAIPSARPLAGIILLLWVGAVS